MMDQQAFQLLMERFDKVDSDNKEIQTCMENHIADDTKIHKVVEKHVTYWTLVLYIAGALFISVAGTVVAAYLR